MVNIINRQRSLYPISDESIWKLETYLSLCHFPKRHQLVKKNMYCKYAYFIEKRLTHSFWLVDNEETTTSFASEGSNAFSMYEYRHLHRSYRERLTLPATGMVHLLYISNTDSNLLVRDNPCDYLF